MWRHHSGMILIVIRYSYTILRYNPHSQVLLHLNRTVILFELQWNKKTKPKQLINISEHLLKCNIPLAREISLLWMNYFKSFYKEISVKFKVWCNHAWFSLNLNFSYELLSIKAKVYGPFEWILTSLLR